MTLTTDAPTKSPSVPPIADKISNRVKDSCRRFGRNSDDANLTVISLK